MHLPKAHAVRDLPTLCNFVRKNPLGILTTAIQSDQHPTIQVSHIPWVLDYQDKGGDSLPRLRGHIARQNPHARAMVEATQREPSTADSCGTKLQDEVVVLFNSPVNHYVSPKFYTHTKPSTGKVVPTWNYCAVQVYGSATIFADSKSEATGIFLSEQLQDLTTLGETHIMGHESPWKVSDAPENHIGLLSKNIIGIGIEITRMEGRFKLSQDKHILDREGVVAGFRGLETRDGAHMADMMISASADPAIAQ